MSEEPKSLGIETTIQTFAGHLNSNFTLELDDEPVELTLTEANPVAATPKGPGVPESIRDDPFALVFRGPADRSMNQGLYTLDHDRLGRLLIFLVPVGIDNEGRYYEAVVN